MPTTDETAREIVKALRDAYEETDKVYFHLRTIIKDAADLIESLTAENAKLKIRDKTAKYHVYKDKWADAQIKLAASQRRERAAVEDLNLSANCDVCKHYDAGEISCAKPTVDSYSCFEWRGPSCLTSSSTMSCAWRLSRSCRWKTT
jgi:hypothetical protein